MIRLTLESARVIRFTEIRPRKFADWMRAVGLSGLVLLAALLAGPSTGEAQDTNTGTSAHVIPLFTPAGDIQQGFARVINHSHGSGTVRITGTDDAGKALLDITRGREQWNDVGRCAGVRILRLSRRRPRQKRREEDQSRQSSKAYRAATPARPDHVVPLQCSEPHRGFFRG